MNEKQSFKKVIYLEIIGDQQILIELKKWIKLNKLFCLLSKVGGARRKYRLIFRNYSTEQLFYLTFDDKIAAHRGYLKNKIPLLFM